MTHAAAPSSPPPASAVSPGPAGADTVLQIERLSHRFGSRSVLYDLNLSIRRGEIVALVGPSGCGKSTLLRAILGTHPPTEGRVLCNGRPVTGPGRDRGIVYQRYTLYPHMTALHNVMFGLMLADCGLLDRLARPFRFAALRKAHREKAMEALKLVSLEHAADLYPSELSGGMMQRVAIAQALVMEPEILLLDEPFASLDEATREGLQQFLLRLYQQNVADKKAGRTPRRSMIIVTHELNEALFVADRVVGLSQYWDAAAEGLLQNGRHPGATFIYDKVAPVFAPADLAAGAAANIPYHLLAAQREDIRRVVMDVAPPATLRPRRAHVQFDEQLRQGLGQGVLAP